MTEGPDREFLTFRLGEEEYAIDILKVQEIQGYGGVTKIARAPEFIKGVINLRGTIVPIIDLRERFGVGDLTYDEFTIVIILHLTHRTVGVVVDSVSDVIKLGEEAIRPAPSFNAAVDTRFIQGLADTDESMLIVLDIDGLMNDASMGLEDTDLGAD
jgi:purine-binding chemotaxis protein CheW